MAPADIVNVVEIGVHLLAKTLPPMSVTVPVVEAPVVVEHVQPAPILECVAPAPVFEFVAPATSVTCAAHALVFESVHRCAL